MTGKHPRLQDRHTRKTVAAQASKSARGYKIGEAAHVLGVKPYVLRFWETQFPFLRPHHASSGHRFYSEADLEAFAMVKRLLHSERFTIEGAKKHIREVGLERALDGIVRPSHERKSRTTAPAAASDRTSGNEHRLRRTLLELKRDLESLRSRLKG
jgi:DNA-binding transcriptional MerR regulator